MTRIAQQQGMLKLIANWIDKTTLSASSCLSKISFAINAYKPDPVKTAVNSGSVIEND